ncbi:hypothetical protein [Massilia timonae]|jgi:hypothetical protein|nr:hypothetical protein [Massilia timonae]
MEPRYAPRWRFGTDRRGAGFDDVARAHHTHKRFLMVAARPVRVDSYE